MKVNPQSPAHNPVPVRDHEPRSKAKAHGLVRQLMEDTFNGASVEIHRARFAHRLTESSAAPVADASTPNPSIDDTTPDDLATVSPDAVLSTLDDDGSLLDVDESGSASFDDSIITSAKAAIEAATITPTYSDLLVRDPFDGRGQQFSWTV